jgi:hypothetical protein
MNIYQWIRFPYKREIAIKLERYMNAQLKLVAPESGTVSENKYNKTLTYILPVPGDVLEDNPSLSRGIINRDWVARYREDVDWVNVQRKSRFVVKLMPVYHNEYLNVLEISIILVHTDNTKQYFVMTESYGAFQNFVPVLHYNPGYGAHMFRFIAEKGVQRFLARVAEARDAYRLFQSLPSKSLSDSPAVLALSHHLNDRLVEISKATGVPTASPGSTYASGRDILTALRRGFTDMRVPL